MWDTSTAGEYATPRAAGAACIAAGTAAAVYVNGVAG